MSTHEPDADLKDAVRSHWQRQPCGTRDVPLEDRRRFFEQIERERYTWEPYLRPFARFEEGRGRRVLEVGVGAGTDFVNWVRQGAIATGVDLTEQGVSLTRERLALEGLEAEVRVADAENLPFDDASFDIVYSWGVVHHSPDTPRAVREIHRVLKPGGAARVMIYHYPSWGCFMVWGVQSVARGRPWESPRKAVFDHLESPGTKVYTLAEAKVLFRDFARVEVRPLLGHGDLLLMRPAEKYGRWYHQLAWKLYPRPLIRATGDRLGTLLLIEATK
jgi:ubiquinone/menaquinone biosynthesis C-methylase UbiE